MSYVFHHAIIVTSHCRQRIEDAFARAPMPKTTIAVSLVNGDHTFMVGPDGSKEGWAASDRGDEARAEFKKWLRAQRYETEDGTYEGSPYQWVEIVYGSDRRSMNMTGAEVTDHEWTEVQSKDEEPDEEDWSCVCGNGTYEPVDDCSECGTSRRQCPACLDYYW